MALGPLHLSYSFQQQQSVTVMKFPAKLFDTIKTAVVHWQCCDWGVSTNEVFQDMSTAVTIKVRLIIFDRFNCSFHYSCLTSSFVGKKQWLFFWTAELSRLPLFLVVRGHLLLKSSRWHKRIVRILESRWNTVVSHLFNKRSSGWRQRWSSLEGISEVTQLHRAWVY